MIVNLNLKNNYCEVIKEKSDPRFKQGGWSEAESTFLYHVLQELKKQGYDVIKKRMGKDGHLVDDTQQYIRTRKWGKEHVDDEFCIYNSEYAIYDAGLEFNTRGVVVLAVVK